MVIIKELHVEGYKKVIEAIDPESDLHCFIAVHSTNLGPSLGGTRIYPYAKKEDAFNDVLKLSKAMTYKSAVAQLGIGGGKSVIIADPLKQKNEKLLLSFAKVVDSLVGDYIAAEDVGSDTKDMGIIRKNTPYVAALETGCSSGDPSRFTAWGVYRGLQAVAQKLWNSPKLTGKKILVQGLGNVGQKLADLLFWENAELLLSEVDTHKLNSLAHLYQAKTISLDEVSTTACDIYAPCALGGVITESNVEYLACKAIAGGANNQLETPLVGEKLLHKGILYAPDYVINAGGLINATAEFNEGGYLAKDALKKVDAIYDTLLQIFNLSEKEGKATNLVADALAEQNIANKQGQRVYPIQFKKN